MSWGRKERASDVAPASNFVAEEGVFCFDVCGAVESYAFGVFVDFEGLVRHGGDEALDLLDVLVGQSAFDGFVDLFARADE